MEIIKELYLQNYQMVNFVILMGVGLLLFWISCRIIIKHEIKKEIKAEEIEKARKEQENKIFKKTENFKW